MQHVGPLLTREDLSTMASRFLTTTWPWGPQGPLAARTLPHTRTHATAYPTYSVISHTLRCHTSEWPNTSNGSASVVVKHYSRNQTVASDLPLQ